MKRFNRLAAPALAVALLLGVAAPASAYFTAWDAASGGKTLTIGTEIKEEYDKEGKHVVIRNNDDSVPVYVRARAYIPSDLLENENGTATIEGEGWLATGGIGDWYVYASDPNTYTILEPGQETSVLNVKFEWPFRAIDVDDGEIASSEVTDDPEAGKSKITVTKADGTEYNIVVVYEYEPVEYEGIAPNTTPKSPSWIRN